MKTILGPSLFLVWNVMHSQNAQAPEQHLLSKTLFALRANPSRQYSGHAYVLGGLALGDRVDDSTGVNAAFGHRGQLIASESSVLACEPPANPQDMRHCHFIGPDEERSQLIRIEGIRRTADSVAVTVRTEGWYLSGGRWAPSNAEYFVAFRRLPKNQLGQAVVTKGTYN